MLQHSVLVSAQNIKSGLKLTHLGVLIALDMIAMDGFVSLEVDIWST